jgi:ABC-2 type transport system permease protein
MVSADFKVRYQNSALGYLWSVLRPLFLFAILYTVFTYVFKVGKGIPHYPVYLLLGIVFWNFFVETTTIGMSSIVGRGDLIRKISIPRYLTVFSASISALINLGINLVVLVLVALINQVDITWTWVLVPILILELYVFSLSLAFILAAMYVRFRDITYIWEVGIQAAFYATPIIYPLALVPLKYQPWFFINPIAQIIQDTRYLFVTREAITAWSFDSVVVGLVPVCIVLAMAVISQLYFKKQAKWFAEYL